MKLYSLLPEERISLNIRADSLDKAIEEMLKQASGELAPVGVKEVQSLLLERERNFSTSIAEGVCIPHLRVEGLKDFLLLLGSSVAGVPAPDNSSKRFHLIFIILTPLTKNTLMLQTLAAVARLLSSPKTRQALVNVKSASRLIKIIEESGVDVKKTLCANDIMNPLDAVAHPDTPLAVAMELLLKSPDEAIPVAEKSGELAGELITRDIIAVGLPKYMNLMEDPSVLGNIEPFELFFKKERNLKVSDLMQTETMIVEPETTVIQIAYQMLSGKQRRAYVIRDKKLVGVIYRKDIVTKVLML